jgi:hypothetical protein
MSNFDREIAAAFDALHSKSSERTWIYARLGYKDSGGYIVNVQNQPGVVYVSMGYEGDKGLAIAQNRIGADTTVGFQRVKMKRENGQLLIREAEVLAAGAGGGGGSTTLVGLTDVDITSPSGGDSLLWDSGAGKWINGTASAVTAHALNGVYHTGTLDDSQAPQFLLRDGTRSLTGNLTVASLVTIDGVDLSAHVADPDAHHDHATAGNSAISISVQAISVALATSSGLAISSGLKVDRAAAFAWTGVHSWTADLQVNADIDFIGAQAITTTSGALSLAPAGDLLMVAGGDIELNPTGDDVFLMSGVKIGTDNYASQLTGWQIDYTGGGDFRYVYADELHAKAFIADLEQALAGGQIISKSVSVLSRPFTAPSGGGSTTLYVKDLPSAPNMAVFQSGDIIRLRQFDRSGGALVIANCWGVVTSYVDDSTAGIDEQHWTFVRSSGANTGTMTAGTVIAANAIVLDYGVSGNGYYEVNAIDGVYAVNSPYAQVVTWTGHPATGSSLRLRIGNLIGVSDPALDPTGYGLYSDNAYLHGVVRTAETIMDDDGLSFEIETLDGSIIVDTENFSKLAWYDDLDTRTGQKMSITGYIDSSGFLEVGKTFNYLNISDDDAAADAAVIRIAATGTLGARVELDSRGTLLLAAGAHTNVLGDFRPLFDVTYDLGSASFRWNNLYVDQLHVTGSISGSTIGGQTWTYPGSMTIDAANAANTTLSVTNSGAGRANLDVDQNITLGGTVDGVDVAALDAAYTGHISNPDAHHDHATAGAGISVSGQVISVDLGTNSGLNVSSGLVVDSSIAGTGLTLTSGVLDVVALSTGGLQANANSIQVKLPSPSGLTADATGLYIHLATNSGLNITSGLAVDSSIAGAGLTLTSGVLDVVSGSGGLSVAANSVSLALGTNSGLSQASGLIVDTSIAGTGLTMTSGVLNAIGGVGITANANDLAINQAFTPTWTGAHIWSSSATFNGALTANGAITLNNNISILGTRNISTDSTNPLTIIPGGNLILSPGSNVVLPTSSYQVDLGAYNRKWKTLYIAELYAETLVAQSVMATIGGRVMVAPTNTLTADCSSGATSITVKYNNFTNGTYIMFEAAPAGVPQFEVMKVTTSSPTGSAGAYVYTVTRNQDGTGANTWLSGDACVSWGAAAGQGYIDLTSTTTAFGSHAGPTVTTYVRTGTTWNNIKPVTSMGNLNGFVSYSGDEYGFAVGNDLTLTPSTGFSGLTADRTGGVQLYNTPVILYSSTDKTVSLSKTDGLQFDNNSGLGKPNWIRWYDDLDAATSSNQIASIYGDHDTSGAGSLLQVNANAVSGITTISTVRLVATGLSPSRSSQVNLTPDYFTIVTNSGSSPSRVGIGFGGTPSSTLQVDESSTATDSTVGVTISQESSGDSLLQWFADGQRWIAGIDNSDSNKFKVNATNDLGTSDLFTIDTSGKVGIGTASPAVLVHVRQNTNAAMRARIENPNSSTAAQAGLDLTNDASHSFQMFMTGSGFTPSGMVTADMGYFNASAGPMMFRTVSAFDMIFGTNNTERLRISSAGLATFTGGINLGDTTLSNYAEGTWTPALKFGGASVGMTYTTQTGKYTRVGNLVTVDVTLTLSAKGSSTGTATITGFPFAAASGTYNNMAAAQWVSWNTALVNLMVSLTTGASAAGLLGITAASTSMVGSVSDTYFTNSSSLAFVLTYFV